MRPRGDVVMRCGLGVRGRLATMTFDAVQRMMVLDSFGRSGLMT